MSDTTYLELVEGVGAEPTHLHGTKGLIVPNPKAGDPAPLTAIGVNIPMPTMSGKDVVTDVQKVVIRQAEQIGDNPLASRIIPGTRIVETTHPAVVNVLVDTGHYAVCDPPAKHAPKPAKPEEAKS